MKTILFKNKGFTLIEIMVAVALLFVTMTFIYETFISQHNNSLIQEEVSDVQQNARIAMDMMTRDIRAAGVGLSTGTAAVQFSTTPSDMLTIFNTTSTYVTTASSVTGGILTVPVSSTAGFNVNDTVTFTSITNYAPRYTCQITGIPLSTQMTFPSTCGGGVTVVGDLIVITAPIVYTLNGAQLLRNGVPLADDIPGFTVNTANPSLIPLSLTAQTKDPVSNINGQARTRVLTGNIMVKNKNL
ncbi:MAG: PilW family protein [Nitrospiria bacterium]